VDANAARAVVDWLLTAPVPALLLLLLGWLMPRGRRIGRAFLALGTIVLLLMLLPLTGKVLAWPLWHSVVPYQGPAARADAVVALTAGVYSDGAGRWWGGRNTARRVARALQIRAALDVPLLVVGGRPKANMPAEAEVAAAQYGLDDARVIRVGLGRNTLESARAVLRAMPALAGRPVLLVTNATHLARAAAVLRSLGVVVAGAGLDTDELGHLAATDFLPSLDGMSLVSDALHEYAGIAWYLATGDIELDDLVRPRVR
jgi:uncharacterized SAM-binding protein YcdF (DUF218 family)